MILEGNGVWELNPHPHPGDHCGIYNYNIRSEAIRITSEIKDLEDREQKRFYSVGR